MNNWIKLTMVAIMLVTAFGCSKTDEDTIDEWVRSADFDGLPRSGAVLFSIGDYSYITTGYGTNSTRFTDTWMFDPSTTSWLEKTRFPGEARNNAVSFSIGGKGYVGLGTNGVTMFKDFYEYDPVNDNWKEIADFPGMARYGAVAFVLNNLGYVGAGQDIDVQDYNDFYSYDPSSNSWSKVSSTPAKRSFAFSFVINGTAYVGGGTNNNSYLSTFYAFDGNTWTEKQPLSGRDDKYDYDLKRINPVTFVIGNHGYIVGGIYNSTLATTWRYNPIGDYWVEHDYFNIGGASVRAQAVGFTNNGVGYITTGRNGSIPLDDTWKFTPQID